MNFLYKKVLILGQFSFKLLELSLPLIELNPMVPDDKMELKILKIENLKLPEAYSDLFFMSDFAVFRVGSHRTVHFMPITNFHFHTAHNKPGEQPRLRELILPVNWK